MPRSRYKLSWRERERRWRKRYRGRDYYFPLKDGETKATSYGRCWAEWQRLKAKIDTTPDQDARQWQVLIDRATDELVTLQSEDTPVNRERWSFIYSMRRQYELCRDRGVPYYFDDDPKAIDFPIMWSHGGDEGPPWADMTITRTTKPETRLPTAIDDFLSEKKREVDHGELSIGRWDVLRRALTDFSDRTDTDDVTALTSDRLVAYRGTLLERIAEGKLAPATSATYMTATKQFVRWLYERDRIDQLPRCLSGKALAITIGPRSKIEVFGRDELTRLLTDTPEPLLLYLLLCLNCGMTQVDIAELRHDEVDLRKRTITRRRTKTKRTKSAPVVTYKLWPATYRLLRQYRSKHPQYVLVNRNGLPLVRRVELNGKVQRIDNIRTAYRRWIRNVDVQQPIKALRATGASTLREHDGYGGFAPLYLGHAPTTVADRHYVRPPQDLFDEAITWLAGQLLPPNLK